MGGVNRLYNSQTLCLSCNSKRELILKISEMAQGKKSFVAYSDWKNIFDELPNEDAGALIKHIFAYVNDENPVSNSVLIRAVFANIKTTLKRDLEKWDCQLRQRSEAGKRSAEIRALTKSNERSTNVDETLRNSTDSVNVSVNDTDIDTVNKKEEDIFLSRDHLSITWGEMNKLIDKYGEVISNDMVNRVLKYRKNAKYKSLYLTALEWIKKDIDKNKPILNGERPKPKLTI